MQKNNGLLRVGSNDKLIEVFSGLGMVIAIGYILIKSI